MPQMMLLSLFRHVLTLSANTWRKNHRWPHTLHMVLCWQKLSLSKFRGMSVFFTKKIIFVIFVSAPSKKVVT